MTTNEIRRRIKLMLPAETFEPRPIHGVAALVVLALLVTLVVALLQWRAPWYVLVPGSVAISQMWAYVTGVAHDATHGAIFKSKFMRKLMGWAGFAVYGFGMEAWRTWHIRNHHAHTNMLGKDIDVVGTAGDDLVKLTDIMVIGSRRWSSLLSLGYLFSLSGIATVYLKDGKYGHAPMNRRRANIEVLGIWSGYLLCLWAMGFWYWLWLLLVPLILTNVTIMAYVATQHNLRPLTETNDPLANTMSVRVPWIIDVIHHYASYHREHHLFPSMSHAAGPVVRRALVELGVEKGPPLGLLHALRLVWETPRLYSGSHELEHRNGTRVDLHGVWQEALEHEVAFIDRASQRAVEQRALVPVESQRVARDLRLASASPKETPAPTRARRAP